MPTLAENLRKIRKAKRLSQPALAKLANVSQQLISQIENGKNTTTKELPQLAKALDVPVYDLDENFEASEKIPPDVRAAFEQIPGAPLSVDEKKIIIGQLDLILQSRKLRNGGNQNNGQPQGD